MDDWTTGGAPNPLVRRTPPHSKEAERSVIAACFDASRGFDELEVPLRPTDFYDAWLATIWETLSSLRERRLPVENVAVANDLERRGVSLTPERRTDLLVLECETVPTAANLNYYAAIVLAMAQKRRLIEAGARIVELGWSTSKTREVFAKASEILFAVTADRAAHKIHSGAALASQLLAHLNDPDRDQGVVSGWYDLDQVIQCFRPGEMSVLAARPSMGKTSLMLSLIATMLDRGERIGICSLEMERLQLTCNQVGSRVGVDTTRIRRGVLDGRGVDGGPDEVQRVFDGVEWLAEFGDRFAVFDGVVNTVTGLARILERMVQLHGIRFAAIDYMQLISGTEHTRGQGRYNEVSEVSIMLKRIAKRLGIHVMALAQLNRKVEERRDKKPIMADLRDSGQVEQDADVIMLLHRPEYYWPDKEEYAGVGIVDVCKNRNGPTGTVRLNFIKEFTRFEPA